MGRLAKHTWTERFGNVRQKRVQNEIVNWKNLRTEILKLGLKGNVNEKGRQAMQKKRKLRHKRTGKRGKIAQPA